MKTTLEKYCEIVGWQGGTIHQTREHFLESSQSERNGIVGKLVDNLRDISDLENVQWFTQANISHIEEVTLALVKQGGK